MFRTETQHAIRALVALAKCGDRMLVRELSTASQVPPPMLAKVMHRLAQHGLVKGQPGPGGGYILALAAGDIRLRDVVALFEGPRFGTSCLFGLPECSDAAPCPLHGFWGGIRRQILAVLDSQDIAGLAGGKYSEGLAGSGVAQSPEAVPNPEGVPNLEAVPGPAPAPHGAEAR